MNKIKRFIVPEEKIIEVWLQEDDSLDCDNVNLKHIYLPMDNHELNTLLSSYKNLIISDSIDNICCFDIDKYTNLITLNKKVKKLLSNKDILFAALDSGLITENDLLYDEYIDDVIENSNIIKLSDAYFDCINENDRLLYLANLFMPINLKDALNENNAFSFFDYESYLKNVVLIDSFMSINGYIIF